MTPTNTLLGLATALLFCLARPVAAQVDESSLILEPGVTFRVYDIGYPIKRLHPLGPDQTPNLDERRDVIDYPAQGGFGEFKSHFFVEALGYLRIEEPGEYSFRLTSDDGSALTIGEAEVVRHDGTHPPTSKDGSIRLVRGLHAYRVVMFENQGGESLRLSWLPPGADDFELVPAEVLFVEKGITRVISPGNKRLLDGRGPVRPGDGLALKSPHPSWILEQIRPTDFEPQVGGMGFLPDGRLVLSSFKPVNNGIFREKPNGTLWVLENATSPDRSDIRAVQIADGFHDPLGVRVLDGEIYVCDRNTITRLADGDGDGTFETREVFASGWVSDNYHHFTFGLAADDRYLYGALSTSIYFKNTIETDGVEGDLVGLNGPNPPHRGTCFRVDRESREIEYLAGGFRTPNGMGIGPDGALFVGDNQGAWLPASKLVHVQPGAFYGHHNGQQKSRVYPNGGHPSLNHEKPETPPAVWLPQNECANSPGQPILLREGEFAGQMLLAEITTGGIRRVALEKVNGVFQGVVFRHSQGFECGLNRLAFGPDGCLYLGGTGSGGNWSWRNRRFGLQRLRPGPGSAFEMHSIAATPAGFVIRFTRPVAREWLEDPANYALTQWHYVPAAPYGGPKHGVQRLGVTRATASRDRLSVQIEVPGLRRRDVVHFRVDPTSEYGDTMWSTEAWYTLNEIPGSESDRRQGSTFGPLDRANLGWFEPGTGDWQVVGDARTHVDDERRLQGTQGTGTILNGETGRTAHLVTRFDHGDVRAHVEFMVPKGSNSGVYFMGRYEIQVLDSFGRETPAHSDCGGIYQRWDPSRGPGKQGYEGVPPRVNASTAPGTWQTFDVVFRAPRFGPDGKKIENARFVEVKHNGKVVHEDVELTGPTRAAMFSDERAYGPLMLQGDHGPVAYRNLRLETIELEE